MKWIKKGAIFIFCIACLVGIVSRISYTDLTQNDINEMNVFTMNTNPFNGDIVKILGEELEQCQYILAVKGTGEREYEFHTTLQNVIVENVFKGDQLEKGNKIKIIGGYYIVFEEMMANMRFVNYMKKNQEYLVFLKERVEGPRGYDDNIYRLPDVIISPIFSYDMEENAMANESIVPYTSVWDNEFFISNKDAFEELKTIKNFYINRYGLS